MLRLIPLALIAAAVFALLTACESTFDKAERVRAKAGKIGKVTAATITQLPGVKAEVDGIIVSSDKTVALVVVHVTATKPDLALLWAPIKINLKDATGKVIATNNVAGTDPLLIHLSSLPKGGEAYYVNDQISLASGTPVSADVVVGGEPAKVDVPKPLKTTKGKIVKSQLGDTWTVTVTNNTDVAQETVLVEGVVREGGKVVGGGTAVAHGLAPGKSTDVTGFIVGSSKGQLTITAPASNGPGGAGAPKTG